MASSNGGGSSDDRRCGTARTRMASTSSPLKSTTAGTSKISLPGQLSVSLPCTLWIALLLVLFRISAFVPFVNVNAHLDCPLPTSSYLRPAMVTRSGWPFRSAQRRKRLGCIRSASMIYLTFLQLGCSCGCKLRGYPRSRVNSGRRRLAQLIQTAGGRTPLRSHRRIVRSVLW